MMLGKLLKAIRLLIDFAQYGEESDHYDGERKIRSLYDGSGDAQRPV